MRPDVERILNQFDALTLADVQAFYDARQAIQEEIPRAARQAGDGFTWDLGVAASRATRNKARTAVFASDTLSAEFKAVLEHLANPYSCLSQGTWNFITECALNACLAHLAADALTLNERAYLTDTWRTALRRTGAAL